jgi:hypothetical protein
VRSVGRVFVLALFVTLVPGCATPRLLNELPGNARHGDGEAIESTSEPASYLLWLLLPFAVALDIVMSPAYLLCGGPPRVPTAADHERSPEHMTGGGGGGDPVGSTVIFFHYRR